MSAIAGILGLPFDSQVLDTMLDTMHHRGPDGTGSYMERQCCLLNSRLAIIAPEDGKQPMALRWQDKEYVITYDGQSCEVRSRVPDPQRYRSGVTRLCPMER